MDIDRSKLVRVSEDTHKELKDLCKSNGWFMSAFVDRLLKEGISNVRGEQRE